MHEFELVLILLTIVVISNILKQFVHVLSIVGVQIVLGIAAVFAFPDLHEVQIEPEMFFCLFIAPLLFLDAKTSSKRDLAHQWKRIVPIAFILVFLTVGIVGGVLTYLLPFIMPSVLFAGVACMTPTDAVAVKSVKSKAHIPRSLLSILEGESLINDASGIVAFQFAVGIAMSGGFSTLREGVFEFSVSFLYVLVGGVLVGVIITAIKSLTTHFLRKLGVESAMLHTLIEVLTPFIVYLVAENFHVSGIIAVVVSGFGHTVVSKRISPEVARVNVQTTATWDMLAFILNGIVFVLLGIQLPRIFESINDEGSIYIWQLALLSVAICAMIVLIRLLFTAFQQVFERSRNTGRKILHNSVILAFSGAKGAVTLATAMSLPLFLPSGESFPYRDCIIFVAACVIILSLLIANFLLPIFAQETEETSTIAMREQSAELEIVKEVIKELTLKIQTLDSTKNNINNEQGLKISEEERELALQTVLNEYMQRLKKLQVNVRTARFLTSTLQNKVLQWQKTYAISCAQRGEISYMLAARYVEQINRTLLKGQITRLERKLLSSQTREVKQIARENTNREDKTKLHFQDARDLYLEMLHKMDGYVLKRLHELEKSCPLPAAHEKKHTTKGSTFEEVDTEELQMLIDEYEMRVKIDRPQGRNRKNLTKELVEIYQETVSEALLLEVDAISRQYELKNITHTKMRSLKQDVDLMEFAISTT